LNWLLALRNYNGIEKSVLRLQDSIVFGKLLEPIRISVRFNHNSLTMHWLAT
jgi:hypothetical protein